MKFIKCVKALVNLNKLIGLKFLILFESFLYDFFLLVFAVLAFDNRLISSTNLKRFIPSCCLITFPKMFPKYLTSSLSDFVGILS